MRISTAYQFNNLELNIQQATGRLYDAQQLVSTGRRINQLSDDPAGVAHALSLKTLSATIDGYNTNLNTAKGVLGYTDNALSDINDLVGSAYQAALQGANSSTDQVARNGLANQITELQQRLVSQGNSRGPSGQYIFAGQKNDAPPYTVGPTGIVYNGDNNNVVVATDPTTTMVVSSPGDPMISDLYNKLDALKNDLIGGNTAALSGVDVQNFQDAQTQISTMRGQVGAKMQTIQNMTSQNAQRKVDLTSSISDIEDVDMSQAIIGFQQAQNAYQAALSVTGQSFKFSLMDFIAA